ncbi:MAG: ubiquinol oxidase subunit II [Desulfobacterales bacterium]
MKNGKRFLFLGSVSLCSAILLTGCSHLPLLFPKGPIGEVNRFTILAAFALMQIVVIPVFILGIWFARKYRATNTTSVYMPKWSYSKKIDLTVWLVPVAIVIVLGSLSWITTHRIDPYKPIESGVKPLTIEAVALDWKWLFIYPDHNVAIVNQLVFPAKVPLSFEITSDSVMSSFFIPQLGSQIYAMAGRRTRLHLMADQPGTFSGHNQQFSGSGYADMHFKAIATTQEDFDVWLQKTRHSSETLDLARYESLAQPSKGYPVTTFSSVKPDLFDLIIGKYRYGDKKDGTASGNSVPLNINTAAWEGHGYVR